MNAKKVIEKEISMSREEFEEITLMLRNIEQKNTKIEEYQALSYKWNLQHHENLKKVIEGLNQISKLLKGTIPPDGLVLIQPVDKIPVDKKTFHDQVLRAYTDNGDGADPLSPELLLLFRDLTDETFDQLKESSAGILLKVAAKWLSESSRPQKVAKSILFLWGCKQTFDKMLNKHENAATIKQCLAALERLDTEGKLVAWLASDSLPVSADEMCQLRGFLERCVDK